MNKTLLAVAVSAAMVASSAAMAGDVTVYGQAMVELANYSNDGASVGAGPSAAGNGTKDKLRVEDNARGRAGFKATEDLGNGMQAFAQFEWKIDTTAGGAATGQRVSQVGLKGGFGAFALGNLKSPYKYSGGVKYDPFVATSLQARGNGGMTSGSRGHNSFIDDAVMYTSPKGPVTVGVLYAPADTDGATAASVKYNAGGVEAFVAIYDDGDNSDYKSTKVGGSWKSGMHKITGQYEMTDSGVTAEPVVLFVGYQGKMGMNTFVVQVGSTDHDDGGVTDDTTYTSVGVVHKMSKMTRIIAGYRDTSDVESVVSVGLRKDFK